MVVNTVLLIGASIAIALLRGGRFGNLVNVQIKYGWVIVVAFLAQYVTLFVDTALVRSVDLLSYAVIFVVALFNRKNFAILLVLVGTVMNYLVMAVNGGRMPVYLPDARLVASKQAVQNLISGTYGKQIVMSSHTHLNLLGDLFFIGHPFPNPTLLSAGDLIVAVGVFLFIQISMKPSRRHSSQGEAHVET